MRTCNYLHPRYSASCVEALWVITNRMLYTPYSHFTTRSETFQVEFFPKGRSKFHTQNLRWEKKSADESFDAKFGFRISHSIHPFSESRLAALFNSPVHIKLYTGARFVDVCIGFQHTQQQRALFAQAAQHAKKRQQTGR